MMACIFHGEFRNKLMVEDKINTQLATKITVVNNLIEMCQQSALAIQNLEKDVTIIKRNTSRNDDTYGNE